LVVIEWLTNRVIRRLDNLRYIFGEEDEIKEILSVSDLDVIDLVGDEV
jgi:hypothetical protein